MLAQMQSTVDAGHDARDGLGIFSVKLPCGRFWGHSGNFPPFSTLVLANTPADSIFVLSVRSNQPWKAPDLRPLLCPKKS
jgi:hypothetical protein